MVERICIAFPLYRVRTVKVLLADQWKEGGGDFIAQVRSGSFASVKSSVPP